MSLGTETTGRRKAAALRTLAQSPVVAYALLAAAIALLVLATWQTPTVVYEIGEGADGLYVREFHGLEQSGDTTYRWSKDVSGIKLLGAQYLGDELRITLRVMGWPAGLGNPHVQVLAGGRTLLEFDPGAEPASYQAAMRTADYPDQNLELGEIVLELRTSTFTPPGDPRALGVAVDAVEVQRRPQWQLLALELALAAGTYLLLRLLGHRPAWAARYVALLLGTVALLDRGYTPERLPYPLYLVCIFGVAWLALPTLRRRSGEGLALWAILLVLLYLPCMLGSWMMDDAYISFRYAQNLVRGNGLVYNPGEVVEGYTNFAWTLLAALALACGGNLANLTTLANTLLGLGTVVLAYAIGRRALAQPSAWALVAPLVLALNGAFAAYTVAGGGMETALFAFLLTLSLWLYQRRPGRYGFLRASPVLALAALTRPEGLLVFGLTWLDSAWGAWRRREPWHTLVGPTLLFLAVFLPYYVWRFCYYGYPLPNTFYAKVGGGLYQVWRGAEYLWGYLLFRGWPLGVVAILGAACLALAAAQRRRRPAGSTTPQHAPLWPFLLFLAGGYTLYVVGVGGDHFPGFRFFVPILPVLALLFQEAFLALARRVRQVVRVRAAATAVLLVVLLSTQIIPAARLLPGGELWDGLTDGMSYVLHQGYAGLWLRANTPPETVLVATGAGAIAYFAERRTIDAWGLNDLYIGHKKMPTMGQGSAGHEKKDIDYVLGQHPDYILCSWGYYFEDDPRLESDYRTIEVPAADGGRICWYQRAMHR